MHQLHVDTSIAILADIHGNSLALDAVLADIESRAEVDEFWFLGDYAAIGYDPVGALERISRIDNAKYVRGNTDRYLVDGSLPWPILSDVENDPSLLGLHLEIVQSFAWSSGAVGTSGWLPWISELPVSFQAVLPDGTHVLAVHAAPGEDDGAGINPDTSVEDLSQILAGYDHDLFFVGHTHVPFDREVTGKRIVNPGSVSNPFPPDLRASYAIMRVGKNVCEVHFHRVEYDREEVINLTKKVSHPASDYISRFMKGQNLPYWHGFRDG
jgi:predicted phosphodiesterase